MGRKQLDPTTKKYGEGFAKKLSLERKKRNWTQDDLAKAAGIPLDTVRSLENGRIGSPGLFIAAAIVYALEGTLDDWMVGVRFKKGKPSHA